jgi:TonB-dependent starch-binding outer membrane protein SusC
MRKPYSLQVIILLLGMLPFALYGQTKVTGKVTDFGSGVSLPGVTVVVVGTNIGTSTDASGTYSIQLPTNSGRLTFSFLGYVPQTVDVSPVVTTLNVQLKESVTSLNEVVVTGLATTVKRANLANAVATISTKEITGTTAPQTLDAAISGKLVGANIVSNSGAPGGGIAIKLRGVTSIYGSSQPLYVIDGIIMDNSSISGGLNAVTKASRGGNASNQDNPSNRVADLNPDDIESIEILKGASAAAIYGSLASAGVVIITTKRGSAGSTKVDFSQDIGVATISKKLGMRTFTADRVKAQYPKSPEALKLFEEAQAANRFIDYEDELYGNKGMIYNSRINVSGGNDKTRFFVGGLIQDEEGIIKNTGYKKNSIRFNLDHVLSKMFDFSLSTNFVNSSADRGLTNNDNSGVSFGVALTSTPNFIDLRPDANGVYPRNPFAGSNFLQTRDLITNNEKTNRFLGGLTLNTYLYETEISSTKLVMRGGVDFYNFKTTALFPRTLQFQSNGNGTNGASIQGNTYNLNTNFSALLVNNLSLSDNAFNFTTTVGVTRENFNRDQILNVATQLIANQTNLNQAGAIDVSQNRLIERNKGLFFQEEFNFRDRIIATAGLRLDKSSNNADVNAFQSFPKASLAVNVANFDFWQIDQVNQLKFRVAYGEAGGFPPFGSKFFAFGASNIDGRPGLMPLTQLGNPDIKNERQKELEAGVDIALFKSKVTLEATVYNKTVSDLILFRNLPPSSGFTKKVVNGGELRNRGLELALGVIPVDMPSFKWDSKTSFWLNRSKITELTIPAFTEGGFGNTLGIFYIEEGKSPTQIRGIKGKEGVQVLGDATPDFQMNFQNFFTVKQNLTFSFLLHWKQGGDNINLTELLTDLGGTSPDYDDDDNGDGKTNAQERLTALGVSAEQFVQDASYLRLREIGVYYTLPQTILGSFYNGLVRNFKVGVSANNLITISDYRSYDPEVSNFGSNGLSTGVEVTPFPASRRLFFHLAIGF